MSIFSDLDIQKLKHVANLLNQPMFLYWPGVIPVILRKILIKVLLPRKPANSAVLAML